MAMRPRLLPMVILAASALLGVKVVELWTGGSAAIAVAMAETKSTATPAKETPAPAKPPKDAAAAAPDKAAADKPGASKDAPEKAAKDKPVPDPLQMSQAEVDELQKLAERRNELDKRAAELREREVLMQAAERRIDEKIAKLQSLQKSIQSTAKAQNDQEDARLQSLAHMYEQMKPKDAARILEQLDVPVLLVMISHMREMKAGPILATMDPAKAKAITLALAEQRKSGSGGPASTAPPSTTQ
jgi:flagellar motility protein MotE (MotC chaperone)